MGVTEAMIPALAEAAVRDVNTLTNPVRLDAAGCGPFARRDVRSSSRTLPA